jgi:hypothetical protein
MYDFEAQVDFLRAEAGGRTRPATSGYMPELVIDGVYWVCRVTFPDAKEVGPGESARVFIDVKQRVLLEPLILVNRPLEFCEGSRVVARGIVTKLHDLAEHAQETRMLAQQQLALVCSPLLAHRAVPTIEVLDKEVVDTLRSKTPAQRLCEAHSMWRYAYSRLLARVRQQSPHQCDAFYLAELRRRMLGSR